MAKSRAQLEAELAALKRSRGINSAIVLGNNLLKWGGLVLISRYIYYSIDSLAGKTTLADVGISFLGNLEVSITIAWVFGFCGIAYGVWQRKLRRDTVEVLQTRNIELERRIDPGRTSSSLTERGDTREEDKI